MKDLQPTIDKSAIGLSMLCIAHCLLVPVATTLVPVVFSVNLGDERFHQLLVLGILPTSLIALMLGCRRHRNWEILAWGILGLIILVLTAILGHDLLGDFGEKIATVVGSSLIIYSHYRNYRLCNELQC